MRHAEVMTLRGHQTVHSQERQLDLLTKQMVHLLRYISFTHEELLPTLRIVVIGRKKEKLRLAQVTMGRQRKGRNQTQTLKC